MNKKVKSKNKKYVKDFMNLLWWREFILNILYGIFVF